MCGESWYLFGHCTEVTALLGCARQGSIFARFGAKLESVSVGCCGMAGTYGHEVKNHANSLGIYELSGIRRCSVCRETAVWRRATPAAAR
jgi:hypothetical protein